jgi:triosephosphate isomerase
MAQASSDASKKYGVAVAVAPPTCMLSEITKYLDTVLAQHLDNVGVGSTTGYAVPETMKSIGVAGALINHSEHRIPTPDITALVDRLKKLGMISVVCVRDNSEMEGYLALDPEYIAIEPPELIGSGKAISKERPELVAEAVDIVRKAGKATKLLCGAGITSSEDVTKAIELGAEGVLVSSRVVKDENPGEKIKELAEAMSRAKRARTI